MSTFHPEYMHKQVAYCLHADCPLSKDCLRYLSYRSAPAFHQALFIDPRGTTGDTCSSYLCGDVIRMARGFKRGLYQLRNKEAAPFQARLSSELGCRRSQYYRYSSGETRITPEQQAIVRSVFAEFGIEGEDAIFDTYEEGYLLD